MPEGEGSEQQQRFCSNCGAEIRSGTRFCVSCGVSLVQGPETHETVPDAATSENVFGAEGLAQGDGSSSHEHRINIGEIPGRMINWFRDLPSVPKLILVGLLLLLTLTVLSPLALIVAALVLGVSVIGLIIRLAQPASIRESIRGWGIAAISSLVLIFVFSGMSSAIYGINLWGGESGNRGGLVGDADDSQYSNSYPSSISEEEREYIEQTISIADETAVLVNRQIALNDQCGGSCLFSETAMQETAENIERMNQLVEDASQITPPEGYEASYEAFSNSWEKRYQAMNYLGMGVQAGSDPYIEGLLIDGNNYQSQAVELAPPEAQRIYQPLYR